MKRVIFFDVDGVLVESSREIMLTSWNEYNQWRSEQLLSHAPFTCDYQDIPASFLASRQEYMKRTHKGYYRVALNIFTLAGFDPTLVSKALIQSVSEADPKLMSATMDRLAHVRQRLLDEGDLSTLSTVYQEVDYEWIQSRMAAGELYLITNNAFSIKSLEAVAFKPNEAFVRGPHGSHHNKAAHINAICQQQGVSLDKVLFVDDSLSSLQDVDQGSDIPSDHCIQNSWAEKKPTEHYPRLDWQSIVDRYQAL